MQMKCIYSGPRVRDPLITKLSLYGLIFIIIIHYIKSSSELEAFFFCVRLPRSKAYRSNMYARGNETWLQIHLRYLSK